MLLDLPDEFIGQPLWTQVAQRIATDVTSGKWKIGDHLPSRRGLAEQYGVALRTMNRAMAQLIADGVLGATSRVATFVPATSRAAPVRVPPAGVSQAPGSTPLLPLIKSHEATASSPEPLMLTGRRVLLLAPLKDGSAWHDRTQGQANDPWTESILHQAEATAGALGGHLICVPVWPTDGDSFAVTLRSSLATHRPDAVGVINLFASDDAWTHICAQQLDILVTPCLLLSTTQAPATFPYLTYDQRQAGFYAARHLAAAGYGRLVFLDLGDAPWIADRLAGVRDSWRGAIAAPRPADYGPIRLLQGTERVAVARRAVAACLAMAEAEGALRWDGTTAIIVPADEFALLALDLIAARGQGAGRDIGVLGFDDLAAGRQRGLSTVRPPLTTYGRELIQVLARGLAGSLTFSPELHQRRLTPEVVARASTLRLHASSPAPVPAPEPASIRLETSA